MTKQTKTTKPAQPKPPVETIIEAMRALHAHEPFQLAALVDYIRQEWDGGKLDVQADQRIYERAVALKDGAIKDAAADIVRVTVCS